MELVGTIGNFCCVALAQRKQRSGGGGWTVNGMTFMNIIRTIVALSVSVGGLCFAADSRPAVRRDAPETIRGAIYVSSNAFNAPQMWKNFSVEETQRDFGYAKKINLNALRLWASYEYWKLEPERFKTSFDQMLGAAEQSGIRIMVSLFERCGKSYSPAEMWSTDPRRAFAMISPSPEVFSPEHKSEWEAPRAFVKWFMENYRNDERLLAIEVMNEPQLQPRNQPPSVPFAKSMFVTAKAMQGSVPLTIGIDDHEDLAEEFIPLGLDFIQFHDNFPPSAEALEEHIQAAIRLGAKHHLPVWLGEWQRVRPSGSGWSGEKLSAEETTPNYASLAPVVQKYPIGSFFWSLMVKRAYLQAQRERGTINGLFWPDGSVWSLADARAIARDPQLDLVEKKSLPPGFLDYLKAKE